MTPTFLRYGCDKVLRQIHVDKAIFPQMETKKFKRLPYGISNDKPEMGGLRLKIPNYTIQTLYWEYIGLLTRDYKNKVIED
jgi:hypothetical protein